MSRFRTVPRRLIALLTAPLIVAAPIAATAQSAAPVQRPLAPNAPPLATRIANLEAFVDGVMAMAIANREMAGGVVVLVANGKVVFEKGYGYANVAAAKPVDPKLTLFRPGSVSKLVTWTALMQLVEQGKVALDDPINKYIDFTIPDTFPQKIRIRDLLTHSPGFEDGYGGMFVGSAADYRELGPWLAERVPARMWAPGTEISYSNYATAVGGYIVQRVSGENFLDYVQRHVFAPLGMTRSTFREPLPAAWAGDAATGYDWRDGRFEPRPPEMIQNIAPAGSLSSTGADMARFMIAHLQDGVLDGKRILKAETARTMRQRLLSNSPGLPGLAHGFLEGRVSNPRVVWHAGNTRDFHSNLILIPEYQTGFFISMTGGDAASTARSELTAMMLDRLIPTAPLPHWTGAAGAVVEGTYRTNRRSYTNHRVDPSSLIQVRRDGDHGLVMNYQGAVIRWVQVGPRVYEQAVPFTSPLGPVGLLQFYGDGDDTRFSFEEQPYTLYRLVS